MFWSEIVKVTIIQGRGGRGVEGGGDKVKGAASEGGLDEGEIGHGFLASISVIFIPVISNRSAPGT